MTLRFLIINGLILSAFGFQNYAFSDESNASKGVVEVTAKLGFKLNKLSEENFEISHFKISSNTVSIPDYALVRVADEESIFIKRNGYYKRVRCRTIEHLKNDHLSISFNDFEKGDELVTNGLGFLRITEIGAYGGMPKAD